MHGNDHDVTDRVKTTEKDSVNREIDRIFLELYPQADTRTLDLAFNDAASLYRGGHPGYLPCDTAYHDIQHVLDVTLAMARLVDGYERSRIGAEPLGQRLFLLGVITALFHDIGYLRTKEEAATCSNGAEFTMVHVSRGGEFLKNYLPRIGMADQAAIAAELIHFTGYERPISSIQVPGLIYRLLGNLLGSADIIAQMSDRCYLEKCRDRLYPEFVAAGMAEKKKADGSIEVIYSSGPDLLQKTPAFYKSANKRLEDDLHGGYAYAEHHFGGQNLYIESVEKNIRFLETVNNEGDASMLKRIPPDTLSKPE